MVMFRRYTQLFKLTIRRLLTALLYNQENILAFISRRTCSTILHPLGVQGYTNLL